MYHPGAAFPDEVHCAGVWQAHLSRDRVSYVITLEYVTYQHTLKQWQVTDTLDSPYQHYLIKAQIVEAHGEDYSVK